MSSYYTVSPTHSKHICNSHKPIHDLKLQKSLLPQRTARQKNKARAHNRVDCPVSAYWRDSLLDCKTTIKLNCALM